MAQPTWRISDLPVPYPEAVDFMEKRVVEIRAGTAPETLWLLEHPPLYTAGTSAKAGDLLSPDRFPVFESGRGGQFTYHGPGQRVIYVMLDVKKRGADVRQFVRDLEEWVIRTLARFNVTAERREGRVGLWVADGGREDKIAAIGIRLRHWVSFHGISINVDPDLNHFNGIVPCGISDSAATPFGVTSLAKLGQIWEQPRLRVKAASRTGWMSGPPRVPGHRALPLGCSGSQPPPDPTR
ncbi:MAG: lipoyl(octanoyl) transferase LipB [Proteobacteria bacterium]|nr:lipoyl(octanoyl) transferase LipB [Pseudomonadota bacterium]